MAGIFCRLQVENVIKIGKPLAPIKPIASNLDTLFFYKNVVFPAQAEYSYFFC